jgi:hypothetical protein
MKRSDMPNVSRLIMPIQCTIQRNSHVIAMALVLALGVLALGVLALDSEKKISESRSQGID